MMPEPCECGGPGVHPYPIGGAWAMACDRCKAEAISNDANSNMRPGNPAKAWDKWREDATGVSS